MQTSLGDGDAAWRIAAGLTPLTVKFAHFRQLEVSLATNQDDEVKKGVLATLWIASADLGDTSRPNPTAHTSTDGQSPNTG